METFLIILITIIPIILWGTYFYVKNPRKQPISEILKIFALGLFSILPVIIFHQYFLDPAGSYLASTLSITNTAVLPAILELLLTMIFIVLFILIFALIQSTILKLFYKLPWAENFKTVYKKMYNLTPLLIFFLLFIVVEVAFNFTLQIDFILSLAGSTLIFAILEEYFKYIVNPFLAFKRLNSIGSAIVNTLYVGLAFAFIENIIFFLNSKGSPDFMTIYIYRSIFTTLLHVCASGILGYFYGRSLFSKSILTNYEIEKGQYNLLESLRNLLRMKKKSMLQNVAITRGFFIAAAIHATFNLLIFLNQIAISAALIVIFSFFIIYLLNLKSTQIQYGLVGTQTMPEEDFEKLRLQISVSQHLKEIREAQNTNSKP